MRTMTDTTNNKNNLTVYLHPGSAAQQPLKNQCNDIAWPTFSAMQHSHRGEDSRMKGHETWILYLIWN